MRAYQNGDDYLDLETGPGIAYQQTSDKNTSTGMIWWVAANLDYHLTEKQQFPPSVEWSVSLDGKNSSWQSRSSLTSQVNGRLSMRLNFTVKYDSNPGQFRQKTDTETSATLVYSF
jgi:putative salt-induced outer membrane protein